MVLARIPDEFWRLSRHLSSGAVRVFVDVLTYSQGQPSDLLIDKGDEARGTYVQGDALADAICELVAAGWWRDEGGRWFVGGPDAVAALQYSRERVEQHAARNRDRQRRYRSNRRDSSALNVPETRPNQTKPMGSVTNGVSNGVTGSGGAGDDEESVAAVVAHLHSDDGAGEALA